MSSARRKNTFEAVTAFVATAETGSFSAAARRLGVTPSAVSQAIRGLEDSLGAALFRRSTRSLSLTDVGNEYLAAVAPALLQLERAADQASGRAGRPSGRLRLTMSRAPFELLVCDALVSFQAAYPDVHLDVTVEARMTDIVKEGFDAGFRYGSSLEKDMVAAQVAPASEAILVASPSYLRGRATPKTPRELLEHRAVMCRSQATGLVLPWNLHAGGEVVQIAPPSATIVHDLTSQIALTVGGLGIVHASASMVSDHLDAGTLARVLPAWSTPLDAVFIYFPARRQQSTALRAFVAFLKRGPRAAGRHRRAP